MTDLDADLAVVGLGAIGAATASRAAALGLRVIGFDRFDPPHERGSSHAETRVTRLAVGEGPMYLPTVARSHEIWRELEAEFDVPLLYQCGGLIVSPRSGGGADGRWTDFVTATARVAADAGIRFDRLSADETRSRFPVLRLRDDEVAGHEPTAGVVMIEQAIRVQLRLARRHGARLHTNEMVVGIDPDDRGVRITTARRSVRVARVVTAAGPWMPELAADDDARSLEVTRQVVCWFEVDDVAAYSVGRLPPILWPGRDITDYLAVFPIAPGATPALKVMGEQFDAATSADDVDREISPEEVADLYERLVTPRLSGVRPQCHRQTVCLYTSTPTEDFLIDHDLRSDRITLVSPCSGHGFKHSAAIGEALAHAAAGEAPNVDLAPFARRSLPSADA